MKRILSVLFLTLLVVVWHVPLTTRTWGMQQFTIADGPVVKVPALSGDAVGDLESMPFETIVVNYGWQRGVYLVYPHTLIITVTAPWVFERSRYPLLEWIQSELDHKTAAPFWPRGELRIVSTEARLWLEEEFFRLEQLVFVANDSLAIIENIPLPQAAGDWQVFNLHGNGIDYIIDDSDQTFIPVQLLPGQGWSFVLVVAGPTIKVAGYELAECVLIVDESGLTGVTIRGQETHKEYRIIGPAGTAVRLLLQR